MSQREILHLLMEHPNKWFLVKDVKQQLNSCQSSTDKSIRKLLNSGDIEQRYVPYKVGRYWYKDRYIRVVVKDDKK